MVQDVRQLEQAMGKVKYGPSRQEEGNLVARKSIFCSKDIRKGQVITEEHLRVVRPGYGLEPKYLEQVIGSVALEDIAFGTPLQFGMFRK